MTSLAVISHAGKTLGGGLSELRRRPEADIGTEVMWHEVDKGRKAAALAKGCLEAGADLILVWAATPPSCRSAIRIAVAARGDT